MVGEPEPHGLVTRLPARVDIELAQDGGNVVVDGPVRDKQSLGDLSVAQPLRHEPEHLYLAGGQVSRVLLRLGTRSARHPVDAALAQPPCDDGRGGPSAQPLQLVKGATKGSVVVGV